MEPDPQKPETVNCKKGDENVDISGFHGEGQWYKGNLHCHTTISDGTLEPEQVAQLYKSHGYAFLAISDHNIFTDFGPDLNSDDFIILPAVEAAAAFSLESGSWRKTHHIHGILAPQVEEGVKPYAHMEEEPLRTYKEPWNPQEAAQELTDTLLSRGCIAIYNHPIWSRVREGDFIDTKGLTAIEILNYGTQIESGTGYDTTYWDTMLRDGRRIWGVATDDNHNHPGLDDSCGGYIMVKAPCLSREAITRSIVEGNFYSSCGPQIFDWGIHDNVAYVTCSPVQRVNFIAGNYVGAGATVLSEDGSDCVDYAILRLRGDETYVRVECIDASGRRAWSNPIFL